MLEFLLMASLSMPPDSSLYAVRTVHGFVAIANDRILDGTSYVDHGAVLSLGLLYSDPDGFFASTRLSAFEGNPDLLPDERLLSLESGVGWRSEAGGNVLSVTLLDYRIEGDSDIPDHQGIAFAVHRGPIGLELLVEPDRPYFLQPYDVFPEYDSRRALLTWNQPLSRNMQWSAGIGRVELDGVDGYRHFVSVGLLWEWRRFEWQLGMVHTVDTMDRPWVTDDEKTRFLLRIARPFRL